MPFSSALPPLVGSIPPGEKVDLKVLRDGKRTMLEVTIEPLEGDRQVSSIEQATDPVDETRMGIVVGEIPEEMRIELGIAKGVIVSDIDPDGAAALAGIRKGDVIESINRKPVESVASLAKIVKDAPVGDPIPILIRRDKAPMFLALNIPEG